MAFISRLFRFARISVPVTTSLRNLSLVNNVNTVACKMPFVPQVTWIWQKNSVLQLPIVNNTQIELPHVLRIPTPFIENNKLDIIEAPSTEEADISKQAARLIIIRRKKMKKHKLKKLRKRMKFENAKRRQRREMRKEKEFQAVLIKQCKDGEKFSAEEYVSERINLYNTIKALEDKNKETPKTIVK